MDAYIRTCIDSQKQHHLDQWQRGLDSALDGWAGLIYDQFSNTDELEETLYNATWHQLGNSPMYYTEIPYRKTTIDIDELPDDVILTATPSKFCINNVNLTVNGVEGKIATKTYLMAGKEYFTLRASLQFNVAKPSSVNAAIIPVGTVLTKKEAIENGFRYIRIG